MISKNEYSASETCKLSQNAILIQYTPNEISVKFFPAFLNDVFNVPSHFLKTGPDFAIVSGEFE